jgi:molybdopterin-containing oxidoreductase family membrane subunit
VWDFFAIATYLTGSLLFLLLPMIPDFALVRDKTTGWRKKTYGMLALGWQGTPKQWHRLESAMQIMAIAIIPVAVSVHTIVSFDFSMAPVLRLSSSRWRRCANSSALKSTCIPFTSRTSENCC